MEGNKHYITVDAAGRILNGWSDGPCPNRDTTGATLLRENAGYQFSLYPDGEQNPALTDWDTGCRLYRWENGQVRAATAAELAEEQAEIEANAPPPVPTEGERIATLEDENRVLRGHLSAQQENSKILEDCLVEMAGVLYA